MALTEVEKKADKKEKPLTKVIIRRLPPTMTQEQFLSQVSPIPDYNYIYHVKGDMSLGENAFSRTYINFVYPEDVFSFKDRFDNYVFVDNKGHEYSAVVEFAPFQKIPKKRGKSRMDPKCNTIESDSYFIEFVANLNKPIEQDAKPEYTLQLNERNDDAKDSTTPLLEYIKNKRAQRLKIREVRREERERRRKEFDRKKEFNKYDAKSYEEKSPTKSFGAKSHLTKVSRNESNNEKTRTDNIEELSEKSPKEKVENKSKEKKYEEKREKKEIKPRFPKKEFIDYHKRDDYSHREYKSKHHDDNKRDEGKVYPKKVKKYSEKREERKIEVQKAEQRKLEQANDSKETNKSDETNVKSKKDISDLEKPHVPHNTKEEKTSNTMKKKDDFEEPKSIPTNATEKESEKEDKRKDSDEKSDSNSSRRIRNKDRPTIPLYRPGMLSKKKQNDTDDSGKITSEK